jgi:hypothetical protein
MKSYLRNILLNKSETKNETYASAFYSNSYGFDEKAERVEKSPSPTRIMQNSEWYNRYRSTHNSPVS